MRRCAEELTRRGETQTATGKKTRTVEPLDGTEWGETEADEAAYDRTMAVASGWFFLPSHG